MTRRVACDRHGHVQLVFTLSNVLSRPIKVAVKVLIAAPLDEGWFLPQGGKTLTLAARASAQLVIEARLPPLLPKGEYAVRVEVVEAGGSGARRDISPSVQLRVEQAILGARSVPTGRETTGDTDVPKSDRRRLKIGFGAVSGFLSALLRHLFGPLVNWFWGGKPSAARVVDTGIVKKALIVIAVIYVMSLGPKLLSAAKPVAFSESSSACTTPLTDQAIADRLKNCAQERDPVQCAEKLPCFQEQSRRLLDSSRFVRFLKTFRSKPGTAPRTKSRASLCDLFRSGAHNELPSIPPGSNGLPVPQRIGIQP